MNNKKIDAQPSTPIIALLARVFRLDKGDKKRKYGYFAGFLSIIVNIGLCAVKLFFGVMLRSLSLIADGVHSLSDVLTSIVMIIGFRLSAKPADRDHPFGHGRADLIATIVIASLLLFVGYEFITHGIARISTPVMTTPHTYVIVILCISVFVKEMLASLAFRMGKIVDSPLLHADAWHHRTDSISTVLVIIGLILYRLGLRYIDGVLSIIIALYIIYIAIAMIRRSASSLMGEAPSPALINHIKMLALSCEGVSDVHHIHVHDYGEKREITVHIRLKSDMRLDDVHRKVTEVEYCIKQEIDDAEITIHAEPEDMNECEPNAEGSKQKDA
jgi:cation diffusion facilitator family transporter